MLLPVFNQRILPVMLQTRTPYLPMLARPKILPLPQDLRPRLLLLLLQDLRLVPVLLDLLDKGTTISHQMIQKI
ncbi:hypothetical protein PTTG_29896 [Puccinia triticina 1-1 BBBD Race 1]|uniref:Uncharacterized protein n=1 Tax=Puccinia triticina (isolate 1-1 / race 1 (BBBD)) TaxID=630390 RepID=A0A180G1K4_PUCT1|nr:hypothetical protein PTTG_29896 [Puccinia triticina 1-1 BBBD Race 1]